MRSKSQQTVQANGLKVAVLVSSYHNEITKKLLNGAKTAFIKSGGSRDNCHSIKVSGAWELPVVASTIARKGQVDGIVALGCIISGETTHDQVIADAIAEGLMTVSISHNLPVGMGVLTCQTLQQANDRADGKNGNKGSEAMNATLSTIAAIRDIHQ
ncbi:MAG: 6,7-dimethyl-8-ribityllumazine synthase [Planctomycetota bacterium]|nr:6,7-dimethyl-8-ribityllumazine synthase [Planctomycetota bacterium]